MPNDDKNGLISRAWNRLSQRKRVYSLEELEGMSPSRLRDIGLHRDARGHYRPW